MGSGGLVALFRGAHQISVHLHVVKHEVVHLAWVTGGFLCLKVQVAEHEVRQPVLAAALHLKEIAAFHPYVLHCNVVAPRHRHVCAALKVEELGPWLHVDEVGHTAADILNPYVLITLRGVGTHLQP